MSKEKFEITIPHTDFVLKSDSIYKIIPKVDADAPDGFREHGTTKVITPTIGNTVHAPYSSEMKVWDTGFYKHSPVLRGMNETEKEKYIEQVNKYIVKPVEEIKGEGILSHQDSNDFFDNFSIELKAYRVFNTADPIQRLALYLALIGKDLAPKEQQSNPIFGKAQYAIVDNEADVNIKQEREMEKNEAIGIFYALSKTDEDKLHDIMEYLGITGSRITDKATLNSVFNLWINDKTSGFQNSKIFIDTYNKFDSEEGGNELYMYKSLKKLHSKSLVKDHRGEIILDGKSLGQGYKLAASYLMTDTDARRKVAEMVQRVDE